MKKTYLDPEMIIELFEEDMLCDDWGLGSGESEGWQSIDDEEDM